MFSNKSLTHVYCAHVQALKEIQGLSDDSPDTNQADVL